MVLSEFVVHLPTTCSWSMVLSESVVHIPTTCSWSMVLSENVVHLPTACSWRFLLLATRFHWFHSNTLGDLAGVLAFVWILVRILQLTLNRIESLILVTFHKNGLSSSFSSLFRTSTIDFGIKFGSASIYFPKFKLARIQHPLHPPSSLRL